MPELKIHTDQQLSLRKIPTLVVCEWEETPFVARISATTELALIVVPHWDQYLDEVTETALEPQLILIEQSWSDQFLPSEIDSLFARWPLSRVVVVYHRLCESDGRTRDHWPLAVRVPVWQLKTRLLAEIDILHGQRKALPITADRDEMAVFQSETSSFSRLIQSSDRSSIDVVIYSADISWSEMLQAVFREAGIQQIRRTNMWKNLESILTASESDTRQLFLLDVDPVRPATISLLVKLLAGLADQQTICLISSFPEKVSSLLNEQGISSPVDERFDLQGILESLNTILP